MFKVNGHTYRVERVDGLRVTHAGRGECAVLIAAVKPPPSGAEGWVIDYSAPRIEPIHVMGDAFAPFLGAAPILEVAEGVAVAALGAEPD